MDKSIKIIIFVLLFSNFAMGIPHFKGLKDVERVLRDADICVSGQIVEDLFVFPDKEQVKKGGRQTPYHFVIFNIHRVIKGTISDAQVLIKYELIGQSDKPVISYKNGNNYLIFINRAIELEENIKNIKSLPFKIYKIDWDMPNIGLDFYKNNSQKEYQILKEYVKALEDKSESYYGVQEIKIGDSIIKMPVKTQEEYEIEIGRRLPPHIQAIIKKKKQTEEKVVYEFPEPKIEPTPLFTWKAWLAMIVLLVGGIAAAYFYLKRQQ